jgi:hypothetical protein
MDERNAVLQKEKLQDGVSFWGGRRGRSLYGNIAKNIWLCLKLFLYRGILEGRLRTDLDMFAYHLSDWKILGFKESI